MLNEIKEVSCACTEFARRAFSVAAPTVNNSLPANIRLCNLVNSFKRHLKTRLFRTP